MQQKKVILIILDGWGIAANPEVSAIDKANTPFVDSLYHRFPHSQLQASGEAVGLPEGQMGNSEVGHMNLGAGRVVYQDLVRIKKAIEDGSLEENEALQSSFAHAKKINRPLHLMGLVSDGGVHAHIDHLIGLVKMAYKAGVPKLNIHVFTDGRDTDPNGGAAYVRQVEENLPSDTYKITSLCGRYFAMDRDNRWERTKKAYDLLLHAVGEKAESAEIALKKAYAKGETDEFIQPVWLGTNDDVIRDGDAVLCFNFRTDRARQITTVLTQKEIPEQKMKPLDLHYTTLTRYDDRFKNVRVIFTKQNLNNTLGELLAAYGKKQIRIAETEKYPHVTFFFSGGREREFEGEKRILCPSPKVATYDLQPEMSANEIVEQIIPELEKREADFICLNFANPDMVGHTGNMEAAIIACETVDTACKKVVEKALENDYTSLVLADHGNADCMRNPDGSPHTAHTAEVVPFFLIDNSLLPKLKDGKLGDIAPTILRIMGLPIPEEMTGEFLFESENTDQNTSLWV